VIGKWVWPLVLLATFGGLIWFFSRKDEPVAATSGQINDTATQISTRPADTSMVTPVAGTMDSLTGNFIYDAGTEIQMKLPDSTVLAVGDNSTEAKLFRMLRDTSFIIDTVDKTKNWITFDRVYFESDESMLKSESHNQIKNIAAILKNFPSSSIKIGGYTDNTGDTVQNNELSDARAKIVMQQIINMGLNPNKISEAVGYGPDHPVCPANDTEECKAKNRRVDLKLASK
jgi:Outer membrane protein and related peptidoglycan-associated (lipo)proteins